MSISASGARLLLALIALGPVAAVAAGCGTSAGSSSPGRTVTVTVTPPSGGSTPTPSGSQAPPTSAAATECTTAVLHVTIGPGNGAAGTSFYDIEFTNAGSGNCFVQGYPGVSLVSAGSTAGSQVGSDAKRDTVAPSRQIVLAPGKAAHAVLSVADAGNFPRSKCSPVTAHWLKVFPPDQTVAAYIPFTTQTCASTSVPTLHITTIGSGA
jgi:hypothetical protein